MTGGAGSTRYCIYESDGNSDPWTLSNNDFWDKPNTIDTVYYWDDDNWVSIENSNFGFETIDNVAYFGDLGSWSNIEDDPQFINADDLRLTPSGGANWAVRTWGLDLSPDIITDKDDVLRTGNGITGWSMGAYEQDE